MKLRELIGEADRTVLAVTLGGGACLALYMNQGSPAFASGVLECTPDDPAAVRWQFAAAFTLLGLVPLAIWRWALRRPVRDLGISVGDHRYGLRFTLLVVPVLILPAVFIGARMTDIRAEYPLARGVGAAAADLALHEGTYLLYYAGYEIFFRGFLTLGLAARIGPYPAVSLSMLVSTAIHLGKPGGEVWGALVVGVVFGWLALRTGSVLWPFVLHAVIGVSTDLFVVFGAGSLRA